MMSCCVYTLANEESHVGRVKKFPLSIFAIHADCDALLHQEQSFNRVVHMKNHARLRMPLARLEFLYHIMHMNYAVVSFVAISYL